ncbi:MAG: hypothetical protein QNK03_13145 [Myxococcota bacterium]|nr:hypothetical protein [Myxococcota bacterium]
MLAAAGALLLGALGAGIARLLGLFGGQAAPSREAAPTPVTAPLRSTIFPPDAGPLLLAVADAVVPRYGPHPAASEIDLVPRLERSIVLSPAGPDLYRNHWRAFETAVRTRVPYAHGRPDAEALSALLWEWFREYRDEADPSVPAGYFEALRRNVLRAYYSSAAGWASVGYAGPVRLSHPVGDASHG